jgi:hypothetical protein
MGDSPSEKPVQPLRARQPEELKCGFTLEKLCLWERPTRGFEVEPPVRHGLCVLIQVWFDCFKLLV